MTIKFYDSEKKKLFQIPAKIEVDLKNLLILDKLVIRKIENKINPCVIIAIKVGDLSTPTQKKLNKMYYGGATYDNKDLKLIIRITKDYIINHRIDVEISELDIKYIQNLLIINQDSMFEAINNQEITDATSNDLLMTCSCFAK